MTGASRLGEDLVTVEQFYRLIPDGQKADLIDGVIYMASPDSDRANDPLPNDYECLQKLLMSART